ncbi:hypothetical protein [Pseudomonas sp. W2I6]|jgi:hypothetical protein|uniref:hypothetical protein n=1 Tax=Pseudomonas TaxID=286 RepID=UPI002781DE7E|nr:hypothetical protein [Pseudomonas sp. W2I6]MDQ0666649.1 hypothetical protein [Pseudomonas sp. W2I6]
MIVKAGEVICVASGVFEQYDRAGPFVATQDFDLDLFVEKVMPPTAEQWEISGLMRNIPRLLLEQGFIIKMPCRRICLGAWGEFEIWEEKDDV